MPGLAGKEYIQDREGGGERRERGGGESVHNREKGEPAQDSQGHITVALSVTGDWRQPRQRPGGELSSRPLAGFYTSWTSWCLAAPGCMHSSILSSIPIDIST